MYRSSSFPLITLPSHLHCHCIRKKNQLLLQAEAISNETWGESSGGAFYIIVPVCAAGGGAGKAHKRRRDAGPGGAAPLDLDERSIDSALHPTAHDDQSAEELHAHVRLFPAMSVFSFHIV